MSATRETSMSPREGIWSLMPSIHAGEVTA